MRLSRSGTTLMELLIAIVLLSVVFYVGTSIYVSSLMMFANGMTAADVTASSELQASVIGKKILTANYGTLTQANSQLNVRVDAAQCQDTALRTPAVTTDDGWWHYRFIAGNLHAVCDGAENTVVAAVDPVLLANVDTAASTFAIQDPGANGLNRVVAMDIVPAAGSPFNRLQTQVALGGTPSNLP